MADPRGVRHPDRPLTTGQKAVLEAIRTLYAGLQRPLTFVEIQNTEPQGMTRGAVPSAIDYLQKRGFVEVRYMYRDSKARSKGRKTRRFVTPLDAPMIPGTREYSSVQDTGPQGILVKLTDRSPPKERDGVPTIGRGVTLQPMRRWEPAIPDYRGEDVRVSDRNGSALVPGRSLRGGLEQWSGAE